MRSEFYNTLLKRELNCRWPVRFFTKGRVTVVYQVLRGELGRAQVHLTADYTNTEVCVDRASITEPVPEHSTVQDFIALARSLARRVCPPDYYVRHVADDLRNIRDTVALAQTQEHDAPLDQHCRSISSQINELIEHSKALRHTLTQIPAGINEAWMSGFHTPMGNKIRLIEQELRELRAILNSFDLEDTEQRSE